MIHEEWKLQMNSKSFNPSSMMQLSSGKTLGLFYSPLSCKKKHNLSVALLTPLKENPPNLWFQLMSKTPLAEQLLGWFQTTTELSLQLQPFNESTKTLERGLLIPFSGFGEQSFSSMPFYEGLENHEFLSLKTPLDEVSAEMQSRLTPNIFQQVALTALQVEQGRVITAQLSNGAKVHADIFISCDLLTPSCLDTMDLKKDRVKSLLQQINLTQTWTTVSLLLNHEESFEDRERGLHLFTDPTSRFEPCLGQFLSTPRRPNGSLWRTLVLCDPEDHQQLAAAIKNLKKQIKKAYPDIFTREYTEKMIIQPLQEGSLEETSRDFVNFSCDFDGPENFHLCHPLFNPHHGFLSELFACQKTLEQVVAEASKKTSEESALAL